MSDLIVMPDGANSYQKWERFVFDTLQRHGVDLENEFFDTAYDIITTECTITEYNDHHIRNALKTIIGDK